MQISEGNTDETSSLDEFFSGVALTDRFTRIAAADQSDIAQTKFRLRMLQQLSELGELFDAIHIEFIHLKGFSTEQAFYGVGEVRQFSDIDILVKSCDLPKVIGVLQGLDFRLQSELSDRQFKEELKTQHAVTLISPSGIEIDLHWRFIQTQYGLNEPIVEALFSNTKKYDHQGVEFCSLDEDLHFYFLCLHAYKSFWLNLKTVVDVSKALSSGRIDLEKVRKYFSKSGAPDIVEVSIELVNRISGTSYKSFLDKNSSLVCGRVLEHLNNSTEPGELERLKMELQLRSSLGDKFKYLKGRLFVPHEEDWNISIPSGLFFLHYIIKPLKVLFRGARSALKF